MRITTAGVLTAAASNEYVATHYVTTTASGGDGSLGSPWTIQEAVDDETEDKFVRLAPGVYEAAGTDINDAYWKPAANNCVFFAQYPISDDPLAENQTIFRNTSNVGSIFGTGIGTGTGVILDGVYFDSYQNADSDGSYQITLWSQGDDWKIRRSRFDGESIGTSNQNHGFIFAQDNSGIVVEDCIFENNAGSGENAAAVMLYYTSGFTVRNCTFSNNETDIFVKGGNIGGNYDNRSTTIEKNRFFGADYTSIMLGYGNVLGTLSESYRSYIQQNIFYDTVKCITILDYGNGAISYYSILNNTAYETAGTIAGNADCFMHFSSGITAGNDNNIIKNNLCAGVGAVWSIEDDGTIGSVELDTAAMDIDYNYIQGETYILRASTDISSWSTWQTTYNHDENGTDDSTPDFTSTTSSSADFLKLGGSSDADTASTTSGPVGAYITGSEEIGVRSSPSY